MTAHRDRDARAASEASSASQPHDSVSIPSLVRASSHGLVLVDPEGLVLAANDRAAALLNRPGNHLAGHGLASVVAEADRPSLARRLAQAAHGEDVADLDLRPALPQGNPDLVSFTFLPVPTPAGRRVLVLVRDLTREQEVRDRATRSEVEAYRRATAENRKLADLGKLVSGVAHELRTPLTFVTNTVTLAGQRIDRLARERPDLAEELQGLQEQNAEVLEGLRRVNRLILELRPLTKNRPHRTARMDLAELVMDAVKVFRGSTDSGTRVVLDLESTHEIPLDKEDMVNVLLNLLNNASQAMDGKGVVKVVTRNRETPPEIRVIDEGPGVAPDASERVFDPFYTTKPDGTGLGLFISRRTVEDHGGTLTCENNPDGRGATFTVRLPHVEP